MEPEALAEPFVTLWRSGACRASCSQRWSAHATYRWRTSRSSCRATSIRSCPRASAWVSRTTTSRHRGRVRSRRSSAAARRGRASRLRSRYSTGGPGARRAAAYLLLQTPAGILRSAVPGVRWAADGRPRRPVAGITGAPASGPLAGALLGLRVVRPRTPVDAHPRAGDRARWARPSVMRRTSFARSRPWRAARATRCRARGASMCRGAIRRGRRGRAPAPHAGHVLRVARHRAAVRAPALGRGRCS